MSTVYTPTPTLITSITIPADGDPKNAASVNVPFEALADGLVLVQAPAADAAEDYPLALRTIRRVQNGPIYPSHLAGVTTPDWFIGTDGVAQALGVVGGNSFVQILNIPDGATHIAVEVWILGAAGHGGVRPGTPGGSPTNGMPTAVFFKRHITTDVLTTIEINADTVGTSILYEQPHAIGTSFLPEVIDNSLYQYFVYVTGEYNGSAVAGLRHLGTIVSFRTTALDSGAS